MEKQVLAVNALAEGSSIRSIERITGIHRDTIMRLGVRIGEACTKMLDITMRNLPCKRVQMDELWGFVGCKNKNIPKEQRRNPNIGDMWIYVAIDSDTKIVPCFYVGKRKRENMENFMNDLCQRMANRIQLSTDALPIYEEAVSYAFGNDVDYAQLVKTFSGSIENGRYSPPDLIKVEKNVIVGRPDKSKISTSHVESQNLTLRMSCRRLTRLTNAFSKKVEHLRAAIGLHYAYQNFSKIHKTLRVTPAMASGLSIINGPWLN
jgi:IS1 family transposase